MDTSTKFQEIVNINPNVNVIQHKDNLFFKGPLGNVSQNFKKIPVIIQHIDNQIHIKTYNNKKKDYAILHTVKSLINNLCEGVINGYTLKMKIVYSHFPISVKIKDNVIYIENFMGERYPRIVNIRGNTQVSINGDDLVLTGIRLTDITQTAANIQLKTKIKNKDPRVFLDGIFTYSKISKSKD